MKRLMLLFLVSFMSCQHTSSQKSTVVVQGLGDVGITDLEIVKSSLSDIYNFESITIVENIDFPTNAFVNIKSPRYRADSLIKFLKYHVHDSVDYVIGVTNQDISTTKRDSNGNIKKPEFKYRDWGIFGLGYRPGKSCIVSTYRLDNPDKELAKSRLQKICVHEIGHNLGLKHCENSETCVMRDAVETIKTVDGESRTLCADCKQKLNLN